MRVVFTSFLFICIVCANALNNPIVKIPLGKIKGYYQESFSKRQYRVFEGVPYAQPPIGNLRFQPPEPVTPWKGTLLATRPGSDCIQYSHISKNPPERVEGSEDCLYINIYTPAKEETQKLLPVILYIHGGAFQFGTGLHTGPHYIMDRDLLLITFNYRVGPFGFLSTEDFVVPGNMGLKDQNLALNWVAKNIEYFGGNPKKITLAGLSAGAASVHYHYLSPLSRGLFFGGMSFSGSALDSWAQTENSLEKANKLGEILGCPTSNTLSLIECLMTRPAVPIAQAVGEFMPWLYNPYTPFGPVVEKESSSPFIDRSPMAIISSGDVADVPWLTTLTSEEGLYPAAEFIANAELMDELDRNWDKIAPHLLDYNYTIAPEHHAEVAEKIRQHYLGDKKINKANSKPLIQMVGDRLFAVGEDKAARMMAMTNSVWFYFYSWRGPYSLSDMFTKSKENFGVSHGDDVFLVLRKMGDEIITNKTCLSMQNKMLDIWESMAKEGIPNAGVPWKKVDPTEKALRYLHIADVNTIKMNKNDNIGDKNFWTTIDFNENKLEDMSCSSTSHHSESHIDL